MKLEELNRLLREIDPAVVLVRPVVLDRVIQSVQGLSWVLWQVPHNQCCLVDRSTLFQFVEQEELYLESNQLLPDQVLLIRMPSAERLAGPVHSILSEYWRLLFHVSAHRELSTRLTNVDVAELRDRIEQLGIVAFEEARNVLEYDRHLQSHASDRETYIEFAAFYLELLYFARNLIPSYFPSSLPSEIVEPILLQDIDAHRLFRATRLLGAPDPELVTDDLADESHDYFHRLRRTAERTLKSGDMVTAAILHTRAARVAPAYYSEPSQRAAREAIYLLISRVMTVLDRNDQEEAWRKVLPVLLDKADQGNRPVEAAILYDLQRACLDHEQVTYTLDLVEWVMSAGDKPIMRELDSQRFVSIPSHFRTASRRLTAARLTDADRQALGRLLSSAVDRSEERLRDRFRTVLTDALHDAGMRPTSHPEQAAVAKTVEELLDRISSSNYLSFADVRDAIARGQMKLPDLNGPHEYLRGDSLLRLDRRLASLLDGIYHRGEFYVRWLERLTSFNFGTTGGRWITRNLSLPFGLAFLFSQFVWLMVYEQGSHPKDSESEAVSFFEGWNATVWFHAAWLSLGVVILGILRSNRVRQWIADGLRNTYRYGRFILWDLPVRVWTHPTIHHFLHSGPFQLAVNYISKPLILSGILFLIFPWLWHHANWTIAATLIGSAMMVNSRLGRAGEAILFQTANIVLQVVRSFPGLIRWISDWFRYFTDVLEWALARGEDWLRLRGKTGPFRIAFRAVLSLLWFPFAFLIRFYLVVLIEPMVNPLKLPLSILFAKFVYPLLTLLGLFTLNPLGSPLVAELAPYISYPIAWILVIGTFYLLPDAVTFLFWEMRENWRLYRANRPSALQPVHVGPNGESLAGLLHWSLHSGTLPKLFYKLRTAEGEAVVTNAWREVRAHREALKAVKESVNRFVTRDLVAVLNPTPGWSGRSLQVGTVEVSTNRIRVELLSKGDEEPALLEWEDRSGWLVVGWAQAGWLAALSPTQIRVMTDALAFLYKRSGVHFVREHLQSQLPKVITRFDIVGAGLLAWSDDNSTAPVLYDFAHRLDDLRPRTRDNLQTVSGPTLNADRLLFSRLTFTWSDWIEVWQADREGRIGPRFGPQDFELVLLPVAAAEDVVAKDTAPITTDSLSIVSATTASNPEPHTSITPAPE